MVTIAMDKQKKLRITTDTTIRQFESNADEVLCLLPALYGDINVTDCEVWLCFSNSQVPNGEQSLNQKAEKYNADYLQYQGLISIDMTFAGGGLPLWIEIRNKAKRVLLKSDTVTLSIVETVNISDDAVKKIVPVLSQWVIRMTQIENSARDVLRQAIEQSNVATKAATIAVKAAKAMEGGE